MSRETDRAVSVLNDAIDALEKREEELLADIREKEEKIEELGKRADSLGEENEQLKADFEQAALKFQETEAANAALVEKIAKLTGK